MNVRPLIVGVVLSTMTLGLTACSIGPTDRRDVCTTFDDLGTDMMNARDNQVFDDADELASAADRFQGAPQLTDDASALSTIADSGSTTMLALDRATRNVASLCGHPLGMGTTSYTSDSGGAEEAAGAESGGSGSSGSSDGSGGTGSSDGTGDGGNSAVSPGNSEPDTGGGSGEPGESAPATTTEAAPESSTAPTDNSSARDALQREVDNDRASVEALLEHWVPQLSSKTEGLVADGMTYDDLAIWNNFQQLKSTYPNALLLWSGDYSTFRRDNYWVTITPVVSSSGHTANTWCDEQNFAADQCYAKFISHTASPKSSSITR